MICRFSNCKLLRDGHLLGEEDLWVRNGIILNPRDVFWGEKRTPDRVIDCKGYIAAPGFIDTQINGENRVAGVEKNLTLFPGALGFDFSSNLDNFPESLCAVAKEILRHGVTAFCPTIVSSTRETYKEAGYVAKIVRNFQFSIFRFYQNLLRMKVAQTKRLY